MRSTYLLTGAMLALSLAVAGCMQPMAPEPLGPGLAVVAPGQGSVTASMRLEPQDLAGRRLLAVVAPWGQADIDHARLSLYDGSHTLVVSTSVSQANLAGTVTYSNLRMNTTYKVVAQAWADAGETQRIDAGSTDESACTTTFTTTNRDTIDVGALRLTLKNKTFSGSTAGSTLHVTDGVVEIRHAAEAVAVIPPPGISSVSPDHGATAGGAALTLTGTGFSNVTAVSIGGTAASFTVVSSTAITAIAPAHGAGSADIVVTNPSGMAVAAGAYTYEAPAPDPTPTPAGQTLHGYSFTSGAATVSGNDVTLPAGDTSVFVIPDNTFDREGMLSFAVDPATFAVGAVRMTFIPGPYDQVSTGDADGLYAMRITRTTDAHGYLAEASGASTPAAFAPFSAGDEIGTSFPAQLSVYKYAGGSPAKASLYLTGWDASYSGPYLAAAFDQVSADTVAIVADGFALGIKLENLTDSPQTVAIDGITGENW